VPSVGGCRQILSDFAVERDDAATVSCEAPGYPQRPAAPDAGGNAEFVVALQTRDWGDLTSSGQPSYLRVGLNLDARCTDSAQTGSCLEPTWATADHRDGPSGIDNAAGQAASATGGTVTVQAQNEENEGLLAYLLRVSGYDGSDVDDEVRVSVFRGTRSDDGKTPNPPRWNGLDTWNVYDRWSLDGSNVVPKYEDTHAYVSGNVLVAHFEELALGGPDPISRLEKVVLVARISSNDGAFAVTDVLLAGRWPIADLVGTAGPATIGGCLDPAHLGSVPAYEQVALAAACSHVDVRSEGDDPARPCDALSVGVRFAGVNAGLGSIVTTGPDMPCPDFTTAICEALTTGNATGVDASSP
jgi:hypothetical protein